MTCKTSRRAARAAGSGLGRGALVAWIALGCNARLAISDEPGTLDAGLGSAGSAGSGGSSVSAGTDAAVSTCQDGIVSGDESDIDCGGSCSPCAEASSCARHGDCQSGVCRAGLCQAAACDDGVKNGTETGVDCGGSTCAACRGAACDCASSAALTALGCETTPDTVSTGPQSFVSDDGQVFVFAMCYGPAGTDTVNTCTTFRWAGSQVQDSYPDTGPLGIAADGRVLMLQRGDGLVLVGADATQRDVPLDFYSRLTLDGSAVIGTTGPAQDGVHTLTRWTPAGGLEPLGDMPFNAEWTIAGVSANGSVATGYAYDGSRFVPFRWDAQSGVQDLGALPEGAIGAQPQVVSRDGSTIAGFTTNALSGNVDIFSWKADGGLAVLAPAVSISYRPEASLLRISADGGRIAGTTNVYDVLQVFSSGSRGGPTLGNGLGILSDMTLDGSLLVGSIEGDGFAWRPPAAGASNTEYELPRFSALLAASGVDHTGWVLGPPTNVSPDGRLVFGTGTCGGVPTYYRWELPR